MIRLAKVRGESMAPTLMPGDYMIIIKARTLRPGFVVLVDHPKYGTIVKRVKSIENDEISLEGDGPDSTSTEAMGSIHVKAVRGRVRWAITAPNGFKRI